ncbi:cationic peptide transport system substrate-binding protein [Rheinheimera pacifica]|uniref:ABC transporter substrate-binding protein n=1 Tax=Rheinheimera pacifica TaxID=173990 RepID=UPI00285535C4|nr:ABC transporter substrate-binding protein [Rheinheimera pacifica]MDR6984587.1 cationic peptide transport system substrate-binding protein [Rheinheimera pacifica]
MNVSFGQIILPAPGRRFLPLCLATLLGACQPQLPETVRSGLVYCSEGSPESFNPQLVTSGTTIDAISQQLYDRLLDIDPQSGELKPLLATQWQVNDSGTVYEFTLRPDVQFHQTEYFSPSRAFNSEDVVFTFNRIMEKNHPFHYQGGGNYPFFQSVDWANLVERVVATSDNTVRFELSRPDSSFLSNLATDFAAILSAEYGAAVLEQGLPGRIDSHPVGTGPFRFKEYQKDVLIRYYRHKTYWRELAKPEQLVFDIVPNNARRMAKLFTHECDVVAFPRVAELGLISQRPDVDVQESTSMNVGFWAFNTTKPPFDNAKVRLALAMAINREAILQAVYFGYATAANSVLPPTSWAYNAELPQLPFDQTQAKALLAEAGYANGFSMDIWAMPVQRLYNPNALKMAEMMQADLAQIGVRATIVSYEWNSFRRKLSNNEHDSVLIGWSADNADPDNFFRPLLSCSAAQTGTNRANWCDANFDRLISQALLTSDQKQRRSYYMAAQQYLAEQMPLLSIAHSQRFQALNSNISGIDINPYGGISLATAVKDVK